MAKQPTNQPTSKPLSALDKQIQNAHQLVGTGRATQAAPALLELSKKHPKDFRIFDLLNSAQASMGRRKEAIAAGKRAVDLCKNIAEVRIRYALALQSGGEFDQALLECERALYYSPDNIHVLHCKLGILIDLADHDQAINLLTEIDRVIKKHNLTSKDTLNISLSKARLSPKFIPAQKIIDELKPLADDTTLSNHFRTNAHHNLGRLSETLGKYDDAIDHWTKGNDINKPKWDPDIFSDYIDKLIKCWQGIEKIPQTDLSPAPIDSSRLIFIVGMMRSGTSLTEQMISQLPGVTPGGEMNAVGRAVTPFESLPHPLGGRALPVTRLIYNQRVINKIAKDAAKPYNELTKEGYITDKQPFNIFYVPMISRIFPNAKIIHCCRDAQDCCLSNFIQSYARSHAHTHDLYWMGRYHADYQRMFKAWHNLSELNILDLHYEQLVADPEAQSKRICNHLGQPWDPSILNFHNSDRTVLTASRDQVRKPIYKSSVKKHEHYTPHLHPLRQGLDRI